MNEQNETANMPVKTNPLKGIVKLPEKLGFTTFSMSLNIAYNLKSLYYLYFLTNVLLIPVGTAGIMMLLGTVWDAVNDPLIGLWSANHTFKSGEKVRPFALLCGVPWAITLVLLFTKLSSSTTVSVILGLVIYFIFEALYTFLCMPYNSLASLASHYDEDRKSINGFRSLGGALGSGIGSVAVVPLVKLFGGLTSGSKIIGPEDAPALFKTALVLGAIAIIGSLVHYFTSKERVKQVSGDDTKLGFFEAYGMLFKCKSWVLDMVYVICYGVCNALIMQNVNYYAAYILGDSSKATPILAVYLVMAIVVSLTTPYIDRKIGRKRTMLLGAAFLILGKIPFIIAPYSEIMVFVNAFTVGIGSTIAFVMFNTNRNNIADLVEWQSGRRLDSMIGAGENLISKLGEALTLYGITFFLERAGFNAEIAVQPQATLDTIIVFLGWAPFAVAIVMLIALLIMDIEKEMNEWRPQDKAYTENTLD